MRLDIGIGALVAIAVVWVLVLGATGSTFWASAVATALAAWVVLSWLGLARTLLQAGRQARTEAQAQEPVGEDDEGLSPEQRRLMSGQ